MHAVEHYELIRRKHFVDGMSQRAIAEELGHSRKFVKKALRHPVPPGYRLTQTKPRPTLDPVRPLIDAWLEEDLTRPVKQRHTAQRIYERLLDEYLGVVRQCAEKDAAYDSFLEHLAELEVNARATKATERRLKQARFPVAKELSEFDFSAVPKLNKSKMLELARADFIDERSNLVFLGAPGTGKSHLAVAVGRAACRTGHRIKFFTAAAWRTSTARRGTNVRSSVSRPAFADSTRSWSTNWITSRWTRPARSICFFSQCYEQTSLIVTTNLPFAEWPATFAGDKRLTGALLDRLTHRVHIVEIKGDSYRLKSSMKTTKQGNQSPARTTTKKQP